ncbi:homeobox protein 5 [Scaptodrosophila lebanonensis]|uniref:Homeobox protein 5 n=1 Tax=Drosophila lebanonensis TaxID=7225 RepID=A0A6J2UBF6_DROLE|nr:homeobox protein 5 [Scaptodrosophila lebanonensis]
MQACNLKRAPATLPTPTSPSPSTPASMHDAANNNNGSPPDFDFQMPCRYFKSSFARSLSLNNNNNSNGNGTLALAKRIEKPQQQQNEVSHLDVNDNEPPTSFSPPPPALPARRPTTNSSSNNNNSNNNKNVGSEQNLTHFNQLLPQQQQQQQILLQQQQQQQQLQQQLQRNSNSLAVWPIQQDANVNGGAAPRGNSNNNNNIGGYDLPQQPPPATHEQTLNVEAVILQNQVDTLQWQLKQTETNCEMYRAVMEEVARFFERYQQQQQQLQIRQQQQQQHLQQQKQSNRHSLGGGSEQIARSKSLHHVHGLGMGVVQTDPNGGLDDGAPLGSCTSSTSYLRARSSTNLMLNKSLLTMNEEQNYESLAPANSYNAFKDFTWRRSPKKNGGAKTRISALDDADEKLNQEAFRLARTIRNLLHTSQQQPDLTQPRHSLSSLSSLAMGGVGRLCKANTSSVLTLLAPPLHNSTGIQAMAGDQFPGMQVGPMAKSSSANAEMLFLRANNMRDSRLSLRSSTDSSVHSTISSTASSSSKIETDEETPRGVGVGDGGDAKQASTVSGSPTNAHGSSTEDESGFSSISSFHDIGLPLSSTLISSNNNNNNNRRLSLSTESRNCTLKPSLAAAHPNNVVGLPHHNPTASTASNPSISLTSSQSPSKTYRNANRYQRFSTLSNEDAAAVLWV